MAKEKIVKLTDKVEVKALEGNKYIKAGTVYNVHPSQVDYLKKNKLAELVK